MHAVIPAAGEGTRLGDLTDDQPKVLVEVGGKPLMQYALESVIEAGAKELVVVIGYRGEDVIDRFGDAFDGVAITYVHQRERQGLAHVIELAKSHVDGQFMIHNGDNIIHADLGAVIDEASAHAGAMLVDEVSLQAASETGVVTIEDGRITGVVEKPDEPPSTTVATGFSVLPNAAFHACALVRPGATGEREISDAINLLVHAGHTISPVRIDGWRVNVNTQDDIRRAEALLDGSSQ